MYTHIFINTWSSDIGEGNYKTTRQEEGLGGEKKDELRENKTNTTPLTQNECCSKSQIKHLEDSNAIIDMGESKNQFIVLIPDEINFLNKDVQRVK